MTQEIFESMIRSLLIGLGPLLIAHGVVSDAATWATIVGAIATLAGFGWGIWAHTKTNMVKSVAKMSEVAKVEVCNTPTGQAIAQRANAPDSTVVVKGN